MPRTHATYDSDFRTEAVNLLLQSGRPLKRVADELGIGVRTAETYRQLIMQKLEAGSIAELVRLVVDAMPKRHSTAPQ